MISKRIVLKFPHKLLDKPIVYKLVKEHDLVFNILQASVGPKKEGLLVLDLSGRKADYDSGMSYLQELGVTVEPLKQDITRDEARCTHCGACVVVCPAGALAPEKETSKVIFDAEKCIACGLCVNACPPRAMKVSF